MLDPERDIHVEFIRPCSSFTEFFSRYGGKHKDVINSPTRKLVSTIMVSKKCIVH